jgi:hypothetical protein
MTSPPPWDAPAADAGGGTTTARAADTRPGRRLIAVMLLTAAALDLARCGIVLATARHAALATGLVAAGLAAAALSLGTARGCQGGRRWSGWAALLIGAASAPQAAASGFHTPYTIPDIATAALGVLLAVAVLATAGQTGQREQFTENPCIIDRRFTPDDPQRNPAVRPGPATWHLMGEPILWGGRDPRSIFRHSIPERCAVPGRIRLWCTAMKYGDGSPAQPNSSVPAPTAAWTRQRGSDAGCARFMPH